MTTQVRPATSGIVSQKEENKVMTTIATASFAPVAPANHYAPLKIADDTYIIRQLVGEKEPVQVYVNSMVILGREPVIVDTGTAGNRKGWLDDVFGLVDPRDVKWIFISHDDHDHTGNLGEAMALCENAALITNWFQLERLVGDYNFPLNRTRWVDDGQSFDAGDRELVAIRPPVFDSPTTRGLYDPKSRVYWGSDFFATPVLGAVEEYSDMDREFRMGGVQMFGSAISPWVHLADEAKYNAQIDRIAGLDIVAAAGAHSPMLRREDIEEVLQVTRTLPASAPAQLPGQDTLDAILASMTAGA